MAGRAQASAPEQSSQSLGGMGTVVAPKPGTEYKFLGEMLPPRMPSSIRMRLGGDLCWLAAHGASDGDLEGAVTFSRVKAARPRMPGRGGYSFDCIAPVGGQRFNGLRGDQAPWPPSDQRPPKAMILDPAQEVRLTRCGSAS